MDIESLIAALREPSAYPWLTAADHGGEVTVIQTHISVVFLVGREVFKLHKPVDFGFLDFTRLGDRKRDCEAEVEVNAELAPGVYRGVAAVVRRDGALIVERDPSALGGEVEGVEIVEWAVWMRRLPESATFKSLLERGELARPQLWALAATLASFYRDGAERAAAHPELARLGDLDTVVENVRENFAQLDAIADEARAAGREPPIDRDLLARLRAATEAELARVRPLIHARFEAGMVRDTHGDLRLDHVYHLGHAAREDAGLISDELLAEVGGRELLVIDRIEFNDRFRWADPICDVAFLLMDLQARGAWQLARCFADDFISACGDGQSGDGQSGDGQGEELLRFYAGYRATVRAKIAAMLAAELEVDEATRAQARAKAEARARLALVELARPRDRPCLVLVAGLPGTGKSMLARGLRETGNFAWIRSDELRKRLAGLNPLASGRAEVGEGLYTHEWSDRTYAACLERAAEVCQAGGRALIDATFIDAGRREAFVNAAVGWGVPTHMLVVSAPAKLVKQRLEARRGDPSDADWAVYEAARARWSPIDPMLCRTNQIDASGSPREMLSEATRALARAGLIE